MCGVCMVLSSLVSIIRMDITATAFKQQLKKRVRKERKACCYA